MQSAWRTLLEDIELMPQDQDFRFQPPPRLEAHSIRTKRKAISIMRRSCSDSLLTAKLNEGSFRKQQSTN